MTCLCMYGTALCNSYTVNCMKKNWEVAITDVWSRFLVMTDFLVLQLFFWICSFPALTLSCTTINFCSVCSSHIGLVVMPLLNILSVLDCNVCICMFLLLVFTAFIAFIIIIIIITYLLTYLLWTFSVWNKTWLIDWLIRPTIIAFRLRFHYGDVVINQNYHSTAIRLGFDYDEKWTCSFFSSRREASYPIRRQRPGHNYNDI